MREGLAKTPTAYLAFYRLKSQTNRDKFCSGNLVGMAHRELNEAPVNFLFSSRFVVFCLSQDHSEIRQWYTTFSLQNSPVG